MGKSNSKLKVEEVRELQRRTLFGRREIQQWHKGFMMDYPQGGFRLGDLQAIFRQYYPFGDPDDFARHLFQLLDSDRSGMVDYTEFVVALSVTARESPDAKLVWAFQLYDTKNDGVLDRDEMLPVVDSIYRMVAHSVVWAPDEDTPEKKVDKIFKFMDTDSDGYLDLLDFRRGAKEDPNLLLALDLYAGIL